MRDSGFCAQGERSQLISPESQHAALAYGLLSDQLEIFAYMSWAGPVDLAGLSS